MQTSLRITFRHMESSPSLEARIREHVAHLERFHQDITRCHVVIEAPSARRRQGAPFEVTVDLTIPGREIVVRTGHAEREAHVDVYVAVRDAFDSIKRQLQAHEALPHGAPRNYDKRAG
ncbi:MAG: ribosome-associated translation inhibitor RaiA [Pseudomonadota bacterium]|nr:ribosome-associated translation inhibitor RaiA [Pseudomonadota bacterium]